MASVLIGRAGGEHVRIDVTGRTWAEISGRTWAEVSVRAGGLRAWVGVDVPADEWQGFSAQVRELDQTLAGVARLATLEGEIDLTIACTTLGALEVTGVLEAYQYRLYFSIDGLDQTDLGPIGRQIAEVLEELHTNGTE